MSNPNDDWKQAFEFKNVRPEDGPLHQQWKDRLHVVYKNAIHSFNKSIHVKKTSQLYKSYIKVIQLRDSFCNVFMNHLKHSKHQKDQKHDSNYKIHQSNHKSSDQIRYLLKYPLLSIITIAVGYPVFKLTMLTSPMSAENQERAKYEKLRKEYMRQIRNFQPTSSFDDYSSSSLR